MFSIWCGVVHGSPFGSYLKAEMGDNGRQVTLPNRKPAGTLISLYMKSTVCGISSEGSPGADAPRIECSSMSFG